MSKPNNSSQKRQNILIPLIIMQTVVIIALLGLYLSERKPRSFIRQNLGAENVHLVDTHYVFGLDLSHYQGNIDWCDLSDSEHPIEYVFLRATMGVDGVDLQFQENWRKAKKHQFLRGAYHYYRPHENSEKQFTNFKAQVKLEAGDFMPVLDIEEKL